MTQYKVVVLSTLSFLAYIYTVQTMILPEKQKTKKTTSKCLAQCASFFLFSFTLLGPAFVVEKS